MGTSASTQRSAFLATDRTDTSQVLAAFEHSSVRGKTVLVTGARHGGIGWETARALASAGAEVVVAARSQELCDDAIERIHTALGAASNATLSSLVFDLSDISSVRTAARRYVASGRPLHILINNAGIMACPLSKTKDGFEAQFGTNHIGHFVLTNELLPALKASAPSRVINLASTAHWMYAPEAGLEWDDLERAEKCYSAWQRYGSSKLANIMHAKELQARYGKDGITAVALHPGMIANTHLARHLSLSWLSILTYPKLYSVVFSEKPKNIPQGAATSVFCALAPLEGTPEAATAPSALKPGAYYSDCHEETGRLHPVATDPAACARLWEVSQRMVDGVETN